MEDYFPILAVSMSETDLFSDLIDALKAQSALGFSELPPSRQAIVRRSKSRHIVTILQNHLKIKHDSINFIATSLVNYYYNHYNESQYFVTRIVFLTISGFMEKGLPEDHPEAYRNALRQAREHIAGRTYEFLDELDVPSAKRAPILREIEHALGLEPPAPVPPEALPEQAAPPSAHAPTSWVDRVMPAETQAPAQGQPRPPLPLPETAPALWDVDKLPEDTPITFINRHYRQWITDDEHSICRRDINKLDPSLVSSLRNHINYHFQQHNEKLISPIPTLKERNDRLVMRHQQEQKEGRGELKPLKDAARLASAIRRRSQ